jgi:hypothetical protein
MLPIALVFYFLLSNDRRGSFKCSRSHLVSEKYKIVQPFMQHLLQNSPPVQLCTSASGFKSV